jgi:hypothetical protein
LPSKINYFSSKINYAVQNYLLCRPKLLVRQNENNSLSPRSSQTDSSTSKSDNSSLLVDRILNANKRFRDQDIDDTANDADINLFF